MEKFLNEHKTKKGQSATHTRIPCIGSNIYGGSYHIPSTELDAFHKLYFQHVVIERNEDFLTEKQYENGPIYIDFDFKYNKDIISRQHSETDINNLVSLYAETLKDFFFITEPFYVYILEKDDVNRLDTLTKDGIHMIIAIKMDHLLQAKLRDNILEKIKKHDCFTDYELPLINKWDMILDEGICKGSTNVQMFGSNKPNHSVYKLTYVFHLELDPLDEEFMTNSIDMDMNFENFQRLSVQYTRIPEFQLKKSENKIEVVIGNSNTDHFSEAMKQNTKVAECFEGDALKIKLGLDYGLFNDYTNTYSDWIHVMFAIKNTLGENGYELWDRFCRINKNKYDPDGSRKCYESLKDTNKKPITIGTLNKIMRDKSPEIYKKICDMVKRQENITSIPSDCHIVENDKEAADIVYSQIKNRIKYCSGIYYFKINHIWTNNIITTNKALMLYILETKIYTRNSEGKMLSFAQNVSTAKRIGDAVLSIAMMQQDNSFYFKFLSSTKHKLCFQNGVLNIKNKKFTLWNDISKDDEVFTPFCISRDYNPIRNETKIKEIDDNVFNKIFESQSLLAKQFLSRGIAGHIEDKAWGLFIGNRNCGKGVIEKLCKMSLEEYITTINSGVFLCERSSSGGDCAKKLSWALGLEFARAAFSQEVIIDVDNPNIKVDGVMIKKTASGGDGVSTRSNYMNEKTIIIQARLFMMANDIGTISPLDVMETCVSFSRTKQFKSQEFINSRIEANADPLELTRYSLADPDIKEKCATIEWKDAFIHIIMDNYIENAVPFNNKYEEENICVKLLERFEITKYDKDFVSYDEIDKWIKSSELNISRKKLCNDLKSFGCKDGRKNEARGIKGLKFKK